MLSYFHAVLLGIVEGLTEFLPVSSTGHLTITEKLIGLKVDDPAVTAYTAIIQLPAILATFIYFWRKIVRLVKAWAAGLRDASQRTAPDYSLAWAVIVGSIPLGIVGFLGRAVIVGPLRSLWVVAAALVLWSAVIWFSERRHGQLVARDALRAEGDVTILDGLWIGLFQCFSLIPGVSRSGTTISLGLVRGLNRVTATELSFFLAIPALTAAGIFQFVEAWGQLPSLGWGPIVVGCIASFVVAYASIAWLLKFVRNHSLNWFVGYRVLLGAAVLVALSAGWLSAN